MYNHKETETGFITSLDYGIKICSSKEKGIRSPMTIEFASTMAEQIKVNSENRTITLTVYGNLERSYLFETLLEHFIRQIRY